MKPVYKVLLVALLVAAVISPLASSSPDGLERVATDLGFIHRGEGNNIINSPVPDYLFPGIQNQAVATAAAGVAGTLATFGIVCGLARLVRKKEAGRG